VLRTASFSVSAATVISTVTAVIQLYCCCIVAAVMFLGVQ
jgi:hypothetical protein